VLRAALPHASLLTISNLAGAAVPVALSIAVSHENGAVDLGRFAGFMALAALTATFSDGGVTNLVISHGASGIDHAIAALHRVRVVRILAFALSGLAIAGIAGLLHFAALPITAIWGAVAVGLSTNIQAARLQLLVASGQVGRVTRIRLWERTGLLAGGIVVLLWADRLEPMLYFLAAWSACASAVITMRVHPRSPDPAPSDPGLWHQTGWFYAVGLLYFGLGQATNTALPELLGPVQAGAFFVAFSLAEGGNLVTTAIANALQRGLYTRLEGGSPLPGLMATARSLVAFGLAAALLATLAAPWVLPFIFGDAGNLAVRPFQVLVWSFPIAMAALPAAAAATAARRPRLHVVNAAWMAVTNLALLAVLVRPAGLVGAAVAIVASRVVGAVVGSWRIMRSFEGPRGRPDRSRTL
jgi:O-antigen/teichoic acid export membrane protein